MLQKTAQISGCGSVSAKVTLVRTYCKLLAYWNAYICSMFEDLNIYYSTCWFAPAKFED